MGGLQGDAGAVELSSACDALLEECLSRGSQDNMSVILVMLLSGRIMRRTNSAKGSQAQKAVLANVTPLVESSNTTNVETFMSPSPTLLVDAVMSTSSASSRDSEGRNSPIKAMRLFDM